MASDHQQSARLGQRTAPTSTGIQFCTITSLPENGFRGQMVFLVDESDFAVFDGEVWLRTDYQFNGVSIRTFVAGSPPIADQVGDMWLNTTTSQLSVWNGAVWLPVRDPAAAAAEAAAAEAAATALAALNVADAKTTTYYMSTPPPSQDPGDLWFNTSTNKLYRRSDDNVNWVELTDGALVAATASLGVIGAKVDQKVSIYRTTFAAKPTTLTATDNGDLLYATDQGNKCYMWTGSAWVSVQDTAITDTSTVAASAMTAAQAAQSTASQALAIADGTIVTYYATTFPWANGDSAHATTNIGDLFVDTDDELAYRWSGTSWNLVNNATTIALIAAENAQTTADGKITAYYTSIQPTVADLGDLWYDTGNGNQVFYCSQVTPAVAWSLVRDDGIQTAIDNANYATDRVDQALMDIALNNIGSIIMYAGQTTFGPPTGYLFCDGGLYIINAYPTLYQVIGNTYGGSLAAGTFAVPDFTNRNPRGAFNGSGSTTLPGVVGGSETTTLSTANLPSHAHDISHDHPSVNTDTQGSHQHTALANATLGSDIGTYKEGAISGRVNDNGALINAGGDHWHHVDLPPFGGSSGATGSGVPVNTVDPYLMVNFIIKSGGFGA